MTNSALARISPDGTALATSSYIGDPNALTIATGVAVDSNIGGVHQQLPGSLRRDRCPRRSDRPVGRRNATLLCWTAHTATSGGQRLPTASRRDRSPATCSSPADEHRRTFRRRPGRRSRSTEAALPTRSSRRCRLGASTHPPPTNLALNRPVVASRPSSATQYAATLRRGRRCVHALVERVQRSAVDLRRPRPDLSPSAK